MFTRPACAGPAELKAKNLAQNPNQPAVPRVGAQYTSAFCVRERLHPLRGAVRSLLQELINCQEPAAEHIVAAIASCVLIAIRHMCKRTLLRLAPHRDGIAGMEILVDHGLLKNKLIVDVCACLLPVLVSRPIQTLLTASWTVYVSSEAAQVR